MDESEDEGLPADPGFGAVDWALLARHFAGETSAEDAAALARWLEEDPSRRWLVAALRDAWDIADPSSRYDADRLWAGVRKRTATPRSGGAVRAAPRHWPLPATRPARGVWWIAAAAAVITVAWGVSRQLAPVAPVLGTERVYATRAGERAVIQLSDGTRITLAPASHVTVSAAFNSGGARDITLDGEAYFAVAHDVRRPLTVRAGATVVRDVGTRFDVRSYGGDPAVRVVVAEGRVAFSAAAPAAMAAPAVLDAGTLAVLARGDTQRPHITAGVDTADYLSWAGGTLRFHDTPLATVVADLSRWYGADVRLGDASLAARRVTADVGDQSLMRALDLMAPAVGARYERRGAAVVLFAGAR
ncbi:MAG TPA: FecR domain-containing protein [Gemmatimonadaceae bacterium]|jgi:transmembrane sensor|nr:FecR domain-containing protein [Gemmatimonadaceae bacterium]